MNVRGWGGADCKGGVGGGRRRGAGGGGERVWTRKEGGEIGGRGGDGGVRESAGEWGVGGGGGVARMLQTGTRTSLSASASKQSAQRETADMPVLMSIAAVGW